MNLDPADKQLREKVWRHELSAPEQAELRAWLAAHPETQADWEAEQALSRMLSRLPDAPVPSNFTARVLQAVEEVDRAEGRSGAAKPWWSSVWAPRVAIASVVLIVLGFTYPVFQVAQRVKLARGLTAAAEVKTVPTVEVLEDYDVIRRMTPAVAADEGLLSLTADLQSLKP